MTTATQNRNAIKAVRNMAIRAGASTEDAERHIMAGADDPGQWSPGATVIIHTEWIWELGSYYDNFDATFDLTDRMNSQGIGGHFEWVNTAVLAFYLD